MIETVKNQSDAHKLANKFAKWLNDERGLNCFGCITITSNSVDDFINICKEIDSVGEVAAFPPDHIALEGGTAYELTGAVHPVRGHCDIYIFDTGKYRLVSVI
mgnify:CR=1 FL=1